jgi:hypothetical protein
MKIDRRRLAEIGGNTPAKSLILLGGGIWRKGGNTPAKSLKSLEAEAEVFPLLRRAPLGAAHQLRINRGSI